MFNLSCFVINCNCEAKLLKLKANYNSGQVRAKMIAIVIVR